MAGRCLALLALVGVLAGCGSPKEKASVSPEQTQRLETTPAADDGKFTIKLQVPFVVGARRTVDISGKQVLERLVKKAGKVDKQQKSTNLVEFKAAIETQEVDDQGREVKMAVHIERFVLIPEGEKEQVAAPAGTVVIAETKGGRTIYLPKQKDQKLSPLTERLLPRTLSPGSGSPDENLAFQIAPPQTVGASWPADKKYLIEQFKGTGATPEQISGSGKLVALKSLDGKKYLQIELTMTVEATGLPQGDLVPQELSLKAVRNMLLPADYWTGPVEESMEVRMKQILRGKPDSASKDTVMDGRSVDTWTRKTVYLQK
jgi:hypothetical protein